jgi:hypothetical protein
MVFTDIIINALLKIDINSKYKAHRRGICLVGFVDEFA